MFKEDSIAAFAAGAFECLSQWFSKLRFVCVCVFRAWGPLTGLLSQSKDWAVSGGRVCLASRWSAPAELGHESRLCWGTKSLCLKVPIYLKFGVL